jgi:hypothetical protein
VGLYHSPRIVTDGLVLCLDAANTKGYDKFENLALNSEAINSWANNGGAISVSANSQIAPNGTLTADVLSQTAATGASRWVSSRGNYTYTSGVTYTLSIWLKKISGTDAQPTINLWVNGFTNQSVGTITTEWVRYSKTFTAASTSGTNTFTGLNVGWDGNGAANNFTFAAWGFQLEIGSSVTDYYATTSTTKIRGTTLTDLSIGGGNNGTLVNGVGYSNGALSFDGVDDYSTIPDITGVTDFSIADNYTVDFWIYLNSTQNNTQNGDNDVVEKWSGDGGYPFTFRYVRASQVISVNVYNGSTSNSTSIQISHSNWWNICGVFNWSSSLLTVYGNGGSVTESIALNLTGNITNNSALNLMRRGNGINYATGNLSNLKIYNKALTALEVQQNFNAQRGRFGI